MRRIVLLAALVAALGLGLELSWKAWAGLPAVSGVLLAAPSAAVRVTIEDFMLVVHGEQGVLSQLQKSMTRAGPSTEKDWKTAKARASVIAGLAESVLAKQLPEKGTKSSWDGFVGSYSKAAARLAEAAAGEKAAAVKTQLEAIRKSCAGCHKAHR